MASQAPMPYNPPVRPYNPTQVYGPAPNINVYQGPPSVPFGAHINSIDAGHATKIAFGTTVGIAAGRTIGGFLGCLGVLVLIAVGLIALGLVARLFNSSDSAPATQSYQKSYDEAFRRNCLKAARQNLWISQSDAAQYCDCALSQIKAGQAEETATAACLERFRH